MTELPSYDELPPRPAGLGVAAGVSLGPMTTSAYSTCSPPRRSGGGCPPHPQGQGLPASTHRSTRPHHPWPRTEAFPATRSYGSALTPSTTSLTTSTHRDRASGISLGHIGYAEDQFYNGATWRGRTSSGAGVQHHGTLGPPRHCRPRRPAGHGPHLGRRRSPTRPRFGHRPDRGRSRVQPRSRAGIEFKPGDILILHTGFIGWYLDLTNEQRDRVEQGEQRHGDRPR